MPLSPKQKRIFDYIARYTLANSESPTIKEIGAYFDMSSPASVHAILVKIEAEGLITRTPNISRGIQVVEHAVNPS